jgi:hypothetical protein
MASEIDLYDGGAITPYEPSPPIQIHTEPGFELTNREIDEYQRAPAAPTLFGQQMPVGTTPAQIQQVLNEVGAKYSQDMAVLKYPAALTNSSIAFIAKNATASPRQVTRTHPFNLHNETGDWLAEAFGNYLAGIPGFTNRQKQSFLTASLKWLVILNQHLASQQQVGTQPRTATPTSDPTTNLTDAQYNQLVEHNNRVQAQTMASLQQKWGSCFKVNIELAQAQLNKQTPAELAVLDRYTGDWPWTHMFNTVELLTAMYDMAIGANSIGVSGADIAKEIAQFEAMLKIPGERARYMKDSAMQSRLRELYSRRGS